MSAYWISTASCWHLTDQGSPYFVQLSASSFWKPSTILCLKRPYLYRMPYPSRGRSSVAAESRKQAASLPRPPLPRAASSIVSRSSRLLPWRFKTSSTSSYTPAHIRLLCTARPIRNSIERYMARLPERCFSRLLACRGEICSITAALTHSWSCQSEAFSTVVLYLLRSLLSRSFANMLLSIISILILSFILGFLFILILWLFFTV